MSWDAAGAIGEIIGAIAVVISLVYLAKQINQNTKQVEEGARTQRFGVLGILNDQWRGFRNNISSNPNAAAVWRKGNEDLHKLNPDERTQFDFLMIEFFWSFANNWIMGVEDGMGEYLREGVKGNIEIYSSPGMKEWWNSSPHKNEYPLDYIAAIDEMFGGSDT